MFDWHKAYESQDLKDIVTLFLDSGLRREAGLKIVEMLLQRPNSRRGAVVEELKRQGLREKFRVLVGGGPATRSWAEEIGADGYGRNAKEAIDVAERLAGRLSCTATR